jgi:hypothetical protein
MRFMMVGIRKGNETAAADAAAGMDAAAAADAVVRMMEYNRSLQRAGVLLGFDGLFPPAAGARLSYTDGTASVTDGLFAEAEEVIACSWIVQVRSREEALEWARRAPMANDEIIEVRQVYERADFSIVVQKDAMQTAAEGFEALSNAKARRV